MALTLIVGGTRSGKSARAEQLAAASGRPVRYLATADGADPGMAGRIEAHRARRPAEWETVVVGDDPAAQLDPDKVNLLDGLGVWLAGALHRGVDVPRAILGLAATPAELIVVAENAGEGLLPPDAISRAWLDALGAGIVRLSAAAAHAEYVVAGRPLSLGSVSAPAPAAAPSPVSEGLRRHGDAEVREGDLDHAVNVLEPGPPGWLREALHAALEGPATRYPNERETVVALALRHGRDPREVVPTNGAAEALWLLGPALRPRLAALIHPGFTETEAGLRAHGIPVTRVLRDPEAGFALDPSAVPAAADLVVVGHPASPSGTLDPEGAIQALRAPGRTLVVDEAFLSMVPGEPGSLAHRSVPEVIVIRSLTKLLSVPGLRAGYALAPPPLAEALRAVRPPWSANALALAALRAAAEHPERLTELALRAAAEGDDLARRLAGLPGVRVWPSVTNFSLIRVADGPAVVAGLRDRGIAVRPAGTFPGLDASFIRLTARSPERNARLVEALRDLVSLG